MDKMTTGWCQVPTWRLGKLHLEIGQSVPQKMPENPWKILEHLFLTTRLSWGMKFHHSFDDVWPHPHQKLLWFARPEARALEHSPGVHRISTILGQLAALGNPDHKPPVRFVFLVKWWWLSWMVYEIVFTIVYLHIFVFSTIDFTLLKSNSTMLGEVLP